MYGNKKIKLRFIRGCIKGSCYAINETIAEDLIKRRIAVPLDKYVPEIEDDSSEAPF